MTARSKIASVLLLLAALASSASAQLGTSNADHNHARTGDGGSTITPLAISVQAGGATLLRGGTTIQNGSLYVAPTATANLYVRVASDTLAGVFIATITANSVITSSRPCIMEITVQSTAALTFTGNFNGDVTTRYKWQVVAGRGGFTSGGNFIPLSCDGSGISGCTAAANKKQRIRIDWDTDVSSTSLLGSMHVTGVDSLSSPTPETLDEGWSWYGDALPSKFTIGSITSAGASNTSPNNTTPFNGFWELYCTEPHQ